MILQGMIFVIAFGLGYKFKDKYSAELRVHTAREILNNDYYFAKYNNLSLIFVAKSFTIHSVVGW